MEMEQAQQQELEFDINDDVIESEFQQPSVQYEEEKTESRTINWHSQINIENLMIIEAKNLINCQEEYNIKNETIMKQNHEINKNIDALKMKIKEEESLLVETSIMADNEEKKLVENLNLTRSTRDILDTMSNYIENFQQKVTSLQSSMINVDYEKIYGSRIKNFLDKAKIIDDIKLPVEEYDKCLLASQKLQNEIAENKNIEISLQNESEKREERQRQLEDALSELDQKIQENYEVTRKHSEELENLRKDNFELELKILDTKNRHSTEMQKLTFERDTLNERIASSKALYVDVGEELEKALSAISDLDQQMEIFQKSLGDTPEVELCALENTSICELEFEKENLLLANQELKESLRLLREREIELVQLNCDEKINLLNSETAIADLQKELLDCQKLYSDEKLDISNREQQKADMEKMIQENTLNMEMEKNSLDIQQKTVIDIESRLELLKSDMSKQKIEFEYQKETVLPYLESKHEDLKKKLAETELQLNKDQKKLEKSKALRSKKIMQCNRAKRYILMYSDTTKNEKSTKPVDTETIESETAENVNHKNETEITKKNIVEDQETPETSTKSILKSPSSSAPNTPKKNVTFTGVPDSESCSSYDISVKDDNLNKALQDILNFEPVPYIRNRKFD